MKTYEQVAKELAEALKQLWRNGKGGGDDCWCEHCRIPNSALAAYEQRLAAGPELSRPWQEQAAQWLEKHAGALCSEYRATSMSEANTARWLAEKLRAEAPSPSQPMPMLDIYLLCGPTNDWVYSTAFIGPGAAEDARTELGTLPEEIQSGLKVVRVTAMEQVK
jgi:hypothetical protein